MNIWVPKRPCISDLSALALYTFLYLLIYFGVHFICLISKIFNPSCWKTVRCVIRVHSMWIRCSRAILCFAFIFILRASTILSQLIRISVMYARRVKRVVCHDRCRRFHKCELLLKARSTPCENTRDQREKKKKKMSLEKNSLTLVRNSKLHREVSGQNKSSLL